MSFDLFEGLAQLSAGNLSWYDDLPAEDKKTAAPFVIARWLTGTADQAQLVRINTFANPYLFALGAEKALLFKLLAAATTGKTRRYYWLKAPGAKATVKLRLEVIKQYYDASTREAAIYSPAVPNADVMEMAEALGWDQEELKKLQKELDGSGSTEKPGSGKKKVR